MGKKSIYLTLILVNLLLLSLNNSLQAQKEALPEDWHLHNFEDGEYNGINLKALRQYLDKSNKKAQPVIVAVLDSGIEVDHEDLKDVMWINRGESIGNESDDDRNNYKDDLHGWNFLGGADGENIDADTYEETRLVAKYQKKFEHVDASSLKGKELDTYQQFKKMEANVIKSRESAGKKLKSLESQVIVIEELTDKMSDVFGNKPINAQTIAMLDNSDPEQARLKGYLDQVIPQVGEMESVDDFKELLLADLEDGLKYYKGKYLYGHNPEFNPRSIVGDDINDKYEQGYGNNDYEGPDAFHGTHVAGIIGATNSNALGLDGVSDKVQIMTVRVVPDGDERDKDVANGIRYAVDNGAKVINMSFGKGYSPSKKVVDDAVKYAAEHDVLLVHAAGNASQDNDLGNNFPNAFFAKKGLFAKKKAKNWLEVGALAPNIGTEMVAPFSNYGKKSVDIFAPGVNIYSTVPDNTYSRASGTSMASPVVAGAAALLRAYFPELSAKQIRKAILKGGREMDIVVNKPGKGDERINFRELSTEGKILNIEKAFMVAEKM